VRIFLTGNGSICRMPIKITFFEFESNQIDFIEFF